MIFSRWWQKNRPNTRLPAFLITGAQKSGPSWLHACLRQDERFFLPEDKDPEIDFRQSRQLGKYKKRFQAASPGQLVGDACAAWFWTDWDSMPSTERPRNCAEEIKTVMGQRLKLIALLRDPMKRAISGYLHHIAFGSLSPNIPIFEADPSLGILALSRYGFHLENWLKHYDPEHIQLLPAPAEADTKEILQTTYRFLDQPFRYQNANSHRIVMPGLNRIMDEDGVWVDLTADVMKRNPLHRNVPVKKVGEKPFARLVSRKDMAKIINALAEDTHHFLALAEKHGWTHHAFEHWSTPPITG